MVKAWLFRIMLLVGALTGFVGWLADYVDYRTYRTQGTPAVLERHSKVAPPGAPYVINDVLVQQLQVRYTAEDGERVVIERSFPKEIVDKLVAGERLEIIYIPDNRRRFYFKDEKLPMSWGWLAFGVVMLVVFIIAMRLPYAAKEADQ